MEMIPLFAAIVLIIFGMYVIWKGFKSKEKEYLIMLAGFIITYHGGFILTIFVSAH